MDPNQQGQSNSGAAGAPVSGAAGPQPGMPPAPAASPVFPAQPTPPVQQPQPMPGVISSGPADGSKKPSRGLLIGIIVIAVLAIAAVIIGIVAATSNSSNSSGSSNNSASAPINMNDLETAYNNLANFVAFGDENTSEQKLDDGKTRSTYDMLNSATNNFLSETALKADKMINTDNSAERVKYFQELDRLYQQIPESLSNYGINVKNIYEYFHDFSNVGYISISSIISRYNVNGLEPTRSYIEKTVITDSDKNGLVEYTRYMREYDLALLNLLNDVKVNQGCEIELENTSNCDFQSSAAYGDYKKASSNIYGGDAYEIRSNYQKAAVHTLLKIYDLIYDSNGGSQ